jgi:predicted hydrolase (HD superfamily)
MAAADIQKEKKMANLTTEKMLGYLKDKNFAKGASRENIYLCEEKLGIPLEEFVSITLAAMQGIHEELGL